MRKNIETNSAKTENKSKIFINLFVAILVFVVSALLTGVILILVDFYRPKNMPILPDVIHERVKETPLIRAADIILYVSLVLEAVFVLFKFKLYSLIILRRVILVYAILSVIRNLTISSTLVPEPKAVCQKENDSNLKLSLNSIINILFDPIKCGDLVLSGRAIGLMIPALIHQHYFGDAVSFIFWAASLIGLFLLIISRYHYTVDIVIALYLTPTTFWAYHTAAEKPQLFTKSKLMNFIFKPLEWSSQIPSSI